MIKNTKGGRKYLSIGDRFRFCVLTFKVEECVSDEVPCARCFFDNYATCYGYSEMGTSTKRFGPDGKEVIFAKEGGEKC